MTRWRRRDRGPEKGWSARRRARRAGILVAAAAVAVLAAPGTAFGYAGGATVADPPPSELNQQQGTMVSGSVLGGLDIYDAGETSGGTYTSPGTSRPAPACPAGVPATGQQVGQPFTYLIGTTVTANAARTPYYSVGWSWPSSLVDPSASSGAAPHSFVLQMLHLGQEIDAAVPSLDPATQYLYVSVRVAEYEYPLSPPVAGQCTYDYHVVGGYGVASTPRTAPASHGSPPAVQSIMDQLEAQLNVSQNLGTPEESPSQASYVFVPTCYWINNPAPVLSAPVSETEYVDVPYSSNGEYVYFYTLAATDLGVTWSFTDGTHAMGVGSPSAGRCSSSVQHVYKTVAAAANVAVSTTVQWTMYWGYAFGGRVTWLNAAGAPGAAQAPAIVVNSAPVTWTLTQPVYQIEGELGS